MFGVLIPGKQVMTEFEEYDGIWAIDIENPGEINVIAFYLNQVNISRISIENLILMNYVKGFE